MEAILGFGIIMTLTGELRYEWVPDAKDNHPTDFSESKQVTQYCPPKTNFNGCDRNPLFFLHHLSDNILHLTYKSQSIVPSVPSKVIIPEV